MLDIDFDHLEEGLLRGTPSPLAAGTVSLPGYGGPEMFQTALDWYQQNQNVNWAQQQAGAIVP